MARPAGTVNRFEHVINKRIDLKDDPRSAYDELEEVMKEAQKSWIIEKIENVNIIDMEDRMGVDVNGKKLPLHNAGMNALYDQLKLTGLISALAVIPNADRAKAIRSEILDAVLSDKKNTFLRFHTADFNGTSEITHVASTNHGVVSELEIFQQIRQAAEPRGYVPIRTYADLNQVKVQLIQPQDTFDLEPFGRRFEQNEFSPSRPDKFFGMLTATLSETTVANEVTTGIYNSICTNGAILGAREDLSLRAVRGAKANFHKFLNILFEEATGQAFLIKSKIEALQANEFDRRSYQRLETLVSDSNLKRPWNEYMEDDMKSLVGTATERDAYDLITFKAHDNRLSPRHQLGFERIGGAFLEAVA